MKVAGSGGLTVSVEVTEGNQELLVHFVLLPLCFFFPVILVILSPVFYIVALAALRCISLAIPLLFRCSNCGAATILCLWGKRTGLLILATCGCLCSLAQPRISRLCFRLLLTDLLDTLASTQASKSLVALMITMSVINSHIRKVALSETRGEVEQLTGSPPSSSGSMLIFTTSTSSSMVSPSAAAAEASPSSSSSGFAA